MGVRDPEPYMGVWEPYMGVRPYDDVMPPPGRRDPLWGQWGVRGGSQGHLDPFGGPKDDLDPLERSARATLTP